MIVRNSLSACPPHYGGRGHGPCLAEGGIWHCRWQLVPPGETGDSPLACRSRDPTGQRSPSAPPCLRWQVYQRPASREQILSSSKQRQQRARRRKPHKTGTQPWKARHGQVGGESCMQINARQTTGRPSAPQGGGRNAPLDTRATSDQRLLCNYASCARASPLLCLRLTLPTAKLRLNAGDIIPKRGASSNKKREICFWRAQTA